MDSFGKMFYWSREILSVVISGITTLQERARRLGGGAYKRED